MSQSTLPFAKVRTEDKNQILNNLRTYTSGDKNKVTGELIKTAAKAVVHSPNSTIGGVPWIKDVPNLGPSVYIPLRGQTMPAFATVADFQGML